MSDNESKGNPGAVGRFAPSPTGPLHFGSLIAAVASSVSCDKWLLRIEDIDTPRNAAGATDSILKTLERCEFAWQRPPMRQSQRLEAYRDALERLKGEGLVYPCGCTRAEIADSAVSQTNSGERPYPGLCRDGVKPGRSPRSWRMRVDPVEVGFDDQIQGRYAQHLAREVGDFVLLRADGIFAYQLAVVVDDAFQGVTHVMRGADLLASTPRQIWLQRALGLPEPVYAHHPVAVGEDGAKLSKQHLAEPVDLMEPALAVRRALRFLNHEPPEGLTCGGMLQWAKSHWDVGRVTKARTLSAGA
ncbi:MAG: tRNA glutamyl-Q(34) synthetase GluQRS [Candidatus Solibacter sp.]|nr:tRNA glutamyl-Q(34) synthetase GluQRS [Candidatus Solibacter sp.]